MSDGLEALSELRGPGALEEELRDFKDTVFTLLLRIIVRFFEKLLV